MLVKNSNQSPSLCRSQSSAIQHDLCIGRQIKIDRAASRNPDVIRLSNSPVQLTRATRQKFILHPAMAKERAALILAQLVPTVVDVRGQPECLALDMPGHALLLHHPVENFRQNQSKAAIF